MRILAERPLAERAAVRDVLAVCRVLVNPADWPAWERVLPAHRCGIGAKTVATLRGRVAVVGVTESLAEVARTRPRLATLLQQLADWRAARLPVGQLLETLRRDVSGQPSNTGRSRMVEPLFYSRGRYECGEPRGSSEPSSPPTRQVIHEQEHLRSATMKSLP